MLGMRRLFGALVGVAVLVGVVPPAEAQEAQEGPLAPVVEGDIGQIHDPTMVQEGGYWYVFSTNGGLVITRSTDRVHWERIGSVFPDGTPDWVRDHLPALDPNLAWAPDISFVDGRWRLYWSVAEFGTRRAVTGLVTNATLDPDSPDYEWVDEGLVLATDDTSRTAAIDTNAVTDEHGDRWLAWGSFWDGVFIRRLDPATGKFLPGAPEYNLASREPWWQGIEAPYLVYRDGWWWLFASFNFCCRGVQSNYSTHVGRSRSLTGPYVDAADQPMLHGDGTTLVGTYGDVVGPGHGSVVPVGDDLVYVHHYYNRSKDGEATLSIRQLVWGPDGWPVAVDPGFVQGTPADVVGRWHLTNYPQECPMRSVDEATLTLRPDGSVAPSGRWRVDGDLLRIEDVAVGDQTRDWWLLVDQANQMGFGRDTRTAAVRAEHQAEGPDAVTTEPCEPAPPTPPPRPATPIVTPPPYTG
jgi:arabinan endo-1,5-alpha-L-arabinosidase